MEDKKENDSQRGESGSRLKAEGQRHEAFRRFLDRYNLSPHIQEMILEAGPPPTWNP